MYAVDLWDDGFILDAQRDHYSTMGESKLERMLRDHRRRGNIPGFWGLLGRQAAAERRILVQF